MSDREYIKFWRALDKNKDKTLTFGEFCKVVSRGNAMPDAKVWENQARLLGIERKVESSARAVCAVCRNLCHLASSPMPAKSFVWQCCLMRSVVSRTRLTSTMAPSARRCSRSTATRMAWCVAPRLFSLWRIVRHPLALLQIDLDEFRTMLYSCGAPITEEEFCMLVDKFDVNGDGCISDTELLGQVRHWELAGGAGDV